MSKKPKRHFKYEPAQSLPELPAIATTWNLSEHYYRSESDPQIEKDARTIERAVKKFITTYRDSDFTESATKLRQALVDYEALEALPHAERVMRYFAFRSVRNVNDHVATKQSNLFAARFRKLTNELLFFSLTIGQIPRETQKKYLADPELTHYHYFLKCVFENSKHRLTEAEERILTLHGDTSRGNWIEATEKILSNRTITFKKKTYTIPEATELIETLAPKDKRTVWNEITAQLKSISEFAEHELTSICLHDKVTDELRGFKKPYSKTVISYENNEKSVQALVEAISTKGFKLSAKFYSLKAKLHNTKQITYANRYDHIADLPKPDFNDAVAVCRDVFYDLHEEYGAIFDRMLTSGHFDVYPKAGKRGGAFMAAGINIPTYVMLNHTSTFKALETLAHEMGHAIHAERSKQQSVLYEDFSTTTAETASTLFEQLVLEKIVTQLSSEDRITLLHDKLTRDIATVQRQIAFFNFELKMHTHIREQGAATKEELAKLMQTCLSEYLGPAVTVTENDGYSYVYIPHVRYGFYVYTYTYGHLMSNVMAQKYHANRTYIDKIDHFLSLGGSDTVENIFKQIGITATKIDTFLESLSTQEQEIKTLEKLTR